MKELRFAKPDYETRGDGSPALFPDAHRVVRMAFGIAGIVDVPTQLYLRALDAFERVTGDGDEERRYTKEEVEVLAALFSDLRDRIEGALDANNVPRGPNGDALKQEASKPLELDDGELDDDRIFEMQSDGRVATLYPRMSLGTFREELSKLVAFFKNASERKLEIAILE